MPSALPKPIPAAHRPTPSVGVASLKKSKKRKPKKRPVAEPLDDSNTLITADSVGILDKDDEELELERAVFGGATPGAVHGVMDLLGNEGVDRTASTNRKRRLGDDNGEDNAISGDDDDEDGGLDFGALDFVVDTRPSRAIDSDADMAADEAEDAMDDSDSDDDNRKSSPKPTPADSHTAPLERTPVWQDPHDARLVVPIADIRRARKLRQNESEKAVDGIEYSRRLREQFERIYPRPTWAMSQPERAKLGLPTFPPPSTTRGPSASTAAAYDFDDGESAEGNIFSSSKSLIGERASRRVGALPPEILEVVRAKDGNQMQYSQTSLCSVSWHPTHPILLTASSSTPSLHLFHIDGKLNNKLQSLSFPDLHPTCARFSRDGREVLATGRRKYFYAFDVEAGKVERVAGIRGRDDDRLLDAFTVGGAEGEPMVAFLGKDGHVDLVDGRTKQWVGDLKMNGSVVAAEFSADGKRVFSIGGDGVVYVWDVGSRRCMHTFVDEGTIKPTTIAVSPNDQILATGNTMGIVNVYNLATAMSSQRPKPLKAVGNLTTSISALTFNATSEMLAISSRAKKDALRLLHVPTRTVFQNWPTAGTPLGHVTCHEFSPGGGYISIGNSKGKALLYRLGHYQSL